MGDGFDETLGSSRSENLMKRSWKSGGAMLGCVGLRHLHWKWVLRRPGRREKPIATCL